MRESRFETARQAAFPKAAKNQPAEDHCRLNPRQNSTARDEQRIRPAARIIFHFSFLISRKRKAESPLEITLHRI